jgi:allantoate deiminase
MTHTLYRAEKIQSRIDELALISDDATCVSRIFGTKAFIDAQQKISAWMLEAGLQVHIDNIGNIRGRLLSKNASAKTFVIASHFDTVINAGKFDGPLGILMGLDLLEQLVDNKTTIPFNIELIAFSDEEGVRFHTTYLGSKVVVGSFDENLLQRKDEHEKTLQAIIEQIGGDTSKLKDDAIAKKDWLGYFEIHIEQGPVLYEQNVPVAVVTAIAGQERIEVIFKGMAGHAGTVPMNMRNDALCAASDFILELEKFALANKEKLVATVGKLNIVNAASNVIPGEVICSIDLRSADENILSIACKDIKSFGETICRKRNIAIDWNPIQNTKPVTCDEQMNNLLSVAIKENDYELIQLVSGAGHDAVPVSLAAPVCMMFVRCFKGISHNPLEDVELKDLAASIAVGDGFMTKLIEIN